MLACSNCSGFIPNDAISCPNCEAETPAAGRGVLGRACQLAAAGAMAMTLMACYGGGYDDGYYEQCYDDFECGSGYICDAYNQCVPDVSTSSTGVVGEQICDDGYDDDDDGLTDCQDPDCDGSQACGTEICGNGIDDNSNGLTDCADPFCDCPATETQCGNFLDDDGDELVDCDDPDCATVCAPGQCGDGTLTATEQCDDQNQDSGDGCSATCQLELDAFCVGLPALALGTQQGDTSLGNNAFESSCAAGPGREVAYTFLAPGAGTLQLSLDGADALGLHVRLGCESSSELDCAPGGAGIEALAIPVLGGEQLTVIVDSAGFDAGAAFSLSASFVSN